MNDNSEYRFAAEKVNLSKEMIELAKSNSFVFSMTTLSEISNDSLWKTYTGDVATGVAIEISIQNNQDDWIDFFISQIRYGEEGNFLKFNQEIERLALKHPECSFEADLARLIIFHKEDLPRWREEKESRIAAAFPFDTSLDRQNVFHDFKTDSDGNGYSFTRFIKMPLFVDTDGLYPNDPLKEKITDKFDKPLPKIEKIYFHKSFCLEGAAYYDFRDELSEYIYWQLGYRVQIERL